MANNNKTIYKDKPVTWVTLIKWFFSPPESYYLEDMESYWFNNFPCGYYHHERGNSCGVHNGKPASFRTAYYIYEGYEWTVTLYRYH